MANTVVQYRLQRQAIFKHCLNIRLSFSEDEWRFLCRFLEADTVDADRKFRTLIAAAIDRWMRLGRELDEPKKDPEGG